MAMISDFMGSFSGADSSDSLRATLSPMGLRDVPFVNTVRNASREWLHDQSAYTLPEAVEWFRRGDGRQFLIILLGGVPVGYCRITDGDTDAEKWVGMDIHPDCRGQGLAHLTYTLLLAALRANGVRRFRLRVLKKNERARHIYDVLGFKVVVDFKEEVEMLLEAEGQS